MGKILPRLLYAGDVPVEASVGGSLLLHRLLLDYPSDQLRVVESNAHVSLPERRLPGVDYRVLALGWPKLLRTRIRDVYSAWLTFATRWRLKTVMRFAQEFRAEAILSVSHGYSWLTAAAVARRLTLPLHLIAHDDWMATRAMPSALDGWAANLFRQTYRQAASRLCISPAMVEQYQQDYGVIGEVLYPSRGPIPTGKAIKPSRHGREGFVLGYAGSVHDQEYLERLRAAALILRPMNGRVRVYSPSVNAVMVAESPDNLEFPGSLPPCEVIPRLQADCDALLVPMAFGRQHAANMRLCFPSKIADYTATSLPLLIWGPAYSSANVWAREAGGGCAEIVESPDPAAAAPALLRLATDPSHRQRLGARTQKLGESCFSHRASTQQFFSALLRLKTRAAQK